MKGKKLLSTLISVSMMLAMATMPANAAVDADTISAANLTVNNTRTNFEDVPDALRYGTSQASQYGNAKLYKLQNVFGLGENEYGIEMIAREQRTYQPFMLVGEANKEYDITDDFYAQTIMYIGDAREKDYFRLGGEYYDGTSRHNQYLWFQGNGRVQVGNRATDDRYGAAYVPNNWYNVTLAYDATAKTTTLYIDGKAFSNASFAGSSLTSKNITTGIRNLGLGVRMEQRTGSENGGLPSWCIMKDMKIVPATYDASASDTTITSDVYTVSAKSLFIQSGATADKASAYVANVLDTDTVETFLSNISVPTGAEKSVVKINADDKRTVAVAGTETMSDDMSLLVKTTDGSMKLYDIQLALSESSLPSIEIVGAPAIYSIDNENNVITVRDTTVGNLKSYINCSTGTTLKVMKVNGREASDSDSVNETMTVVAEKKGNKKSYTIEIANTTVINPTASLSSNSYTEGYVVFDATIKGTTLTRISNVSGANNRLVGMGTGGTTVVYGTTTEDVSYKVKKAFMPTSGELAYRVESATNGWVHHNSKTGLNSNSTEAYGKKTIVNYKLQLDSDAGAVFTINHEKSSSGGVAISSTNATGVGDFMRFADNKIYLGGRFGGSALTDSKIEIGTYENDKEYDVVMVQSTPASSGTTDLVIEAIYLNGTKIFPTADYAGEDGYYHTTLKAETNKIYAIRSIQISSLGNVYWGGINVYMADDYNPARDAEEPGFEAADLTLTPAEGITIDSSINTIKGWNGTVEDLKADLDTDVNAAIKVYDVTGTTELTNTTALAIGMIVKVYDVNEPSSAAYYVLISNVDVDYGSIQKNSDDKKVNVTRKISVFKSLDEEANISLIFASYLGDKLVEVDVDAIPVQKIGDYNFSATVAKGEYTYRAMLWDMSTLTPYEASADITIQ